MKPIVILSCLILILSACDKNDDSTRTNIIIGIKSIENLLVTDINPDITLGDFQTKDSCFIDVNNDPSMIFLYAQRTHGSRKD